MRELGQREESLKTLDQILAQVPYYTAALKDKSEILSELGRAEEATKVLEQALEVIEEALHTDPANIEALHMRASILQRLGHSDGR